MERLGLTYSSHAAFYGEDRRRLEGAEASFGDDWAGDGGPWHLGYIKGTNELYLGAPGGGPVELLARLGTEELERLLAGWQEAESLAWLRARLATPRPGPRRRLSALGA